ncbi:unnamed protein product [Spirodela intermedia]|uniref:non-specific serine/threonine protein kinase n=1 Tax=Spirodela intermedia TaxID=51605 RepID=A0A7I8JDU5_SPIIN|nr:unnamed protein product [Spirodela intermedia]CAA6668316.1 unnamed protein product [Spirodela intermedia]
MSMTLAAVLGGAAGAVALVGAVTIACVLWRMHHRRASRASEPNSSDPSLQVSQSIRPSLRGCSSYSFDAQGARCFTLEELGQAANYFNALNFIGAGKFGDVYKGLLNDMIVAIKRRPAAPVEYLSSIRHRNLVSLLGYCQDSGLQMLVYEYVPNGSISAHLYGASQTPSEKLEFKHRLSIAHGAAKGLAFLHSLSPPLLHTDFKTANLLVDENFAPKVADAGLRNFLSKIGGNGQKMTADDLFLDPGINEVELTEKSDVYSFGVFLLELVSGQAAAEFQFIGPHESIIKWVNKPPRWRGSPIHHRGVREFLRLAARCLSPPPGFGRPPMSVVVAELDRILEKERSLTTFMGEATPSVTLGSELFTS